MRARLLLVIAPFLLACSATTAPSGGAPARSAATVPTGSNPGAEKGAAPEPGARALRVLLGRVPDSNRFRGIACSKGPGTRQTCERHINRWVGREVSFVGGDHAKILRAVDIRSGDGSTVRALELDRAPAPIAVFPAGAVQLSRQPAT